jgi:hypothetical protein
MKLGINYNNGISDAFIPALSQRGDGGTSWRTGSGGIITSFEAFGVNHLEEVDANNVEMQAKFSTIFAAAGVDQVFKINRR